MKVLVCGYGSMGKRHAANATALGHYVCVHEPNIAQAVIAAADGFVCYEKQRNAFAAGFDAVIIASPAAAHAEQFWLARASTPTYSGATPVPIFVEKPLALSVDDFYGEDCGRPTVTRRVQVGYMLRFHPGIQHLKELIQKYPPLAARVCVSVDGSQWPGKAYADALLECSHELDLAHYLFGPGTLVSASRAGEDSIWQLQTDHAGVPVQTHLDTRRKGYERSIEIIANEATIRWSWWPVGQSRWQWEVVNGSDITRGEARPDDLYRAEMKAFFDGDAAVACGLSDGLKVLALCDAARSSCLTANGAIPSVK
jgi:predicted dehydrogenase